MEENPLAAAIARIAGRGEKGSKRSVLIQTEEQRDDDRQTATAENI